MHDIQGNRVTQSELKGTGSTCAFPTALLELLGSWIVHSLDNAI